MTANCTVAKRERLKEARRKLLAFPSVYGASLLSPAEGPQDRWTLELALGPEGDGVGSELALVQHRYRLVNLDTSRRSPDETRVVFALDARS